MSNRPSNVDPVELAELYVAGALTDEERTLVESRLRSGDAAFVSAVKALRAVGEHLAAAVVPVLPPPRVRAALAARLKEELAAPGFMSAAGLEPDPTAEDPLRWVILRGNGLEWKATGVPGVRSRNLFVDRQSHRLTVLIQMAAGARYPNHEHPGAEECMVIDGDLHIAGTVLGKFDYLRTPPGGDHGEPWTETGCLLLVTCPIAA